MLSDKAGGRASTGLQRQGRPRPRHAACSHAGRGNGHCGAQGAGTKCIDGHGREREVRGRRDMGSAVVPAVYCTSPLPPSLNSHATGAHVQIDLQARSGGQAAVVAAIGSASPPAPLALPSCNMQQPCTCLARSGGRPWALCSWGGWRGKITRRHDLIRDGLCVEGQRAQRAAWRGGRQCARAGAPGQRAHAQQPGRAHPCRAPC